MIKPTMESDLARFWAKVDKSGECWLWTASTKPNGYGQFQVGRKVVYAHRYAWELENGSAPAGVDMDHVCRVRICVNPGHLRPTSRKQNMENRSGPQENNRTGLIGVNWDKARGKYKAQVGHNGVKIFIGRFDTAEEAYVAALARRVELFTHNDLDRKTP